jgi:hypothetical protein
LIQNVRVSKSVPTKGLLPLRVGYLIESVLQDASNLCPNPLFILNLGDNLMHDDVNGDKRPADFDAASEENEVAGLFTNFFPQTKLFTVVGNNDSPTHCDYKISPVDFRARFSHIWYPLIDTNWQNNANDFNEDGYFISSLPGLAKVKLIGLDSTYFLNSNITSNQSKAQMSWLTSQLVKISGDPDETIWMAFHIPPGMNDYDMMRKAEKGGRLDTNGIWGAAIQTEFCKALAQTDRAPYVFCGHTHRDSFRVIYHVESGATNPVASVHIAPSVSPCFQNNPAYQVFDVDTNTGVIMNYTTYYLSLEENPIGTN